VGVLVKLNFKAADPKGLEAMYRAVGLPCTLDIGPVGIVVYASSPANVRAIAQSLARAPRALQVPVQVEEPVFEKDEDPETAFVACVKFDWNKMPVGSR
jgi:hypothetical protein